MPELPDLEVMKNVLTKRVVALRIASAEVRIPTVIRIPSPQEFCAVLADNSIQEIHRRGKYLLFTLKTGHILALHLMLTGRLQLCEPAQRYPPKLCWLLTFAKPTGAGVSQQLRYYDEQVLGRVYLMRQGQLSLIPGFAKLGPDALSPELTSEMFRQRLQRYTGQVKGLLLNEEFIAGIGNAYADEILYAAGIHPFRPRTSLSDEEGRRLYQAIRSVLVEAIPQIAKGVGQRLDVEYRAFLKVHRRGGQPCSKCQTPISDVTLANRVTSFCARCQPPAEAAAKLL